MLRRILELRVLLAMAAALVVGAWGLHGHPLDPANVYLQIVELSHPTAFLVIVYGYATLWFTTPFLAASVLGSILTIVVYRHEPRVRPRPLPPYPEPETRPAQMLVLGEQHFPTTTGRAPTPTWLTIPQRGLYTGIAVLGAVGTGKTSACLYPYADQLLRWRADDPDGKPVAWCWR